MSKNVFEAKRSIYINYEFTDSFCKSNEKVFLKKVYLDSVNNLQSLLEF